MVWQDSEVGEFANANYVNLRVTVSDDDYSEWREKFNTPGTPTVVFLDAEGEEVDRFVGFGGEDAGKEEVFQMLKDYPQGINTLAAVKAEQEQNPEDIDVNYKLGTSFGRWALGLKGIQLVTTFEIPYANVKSQIVSSRSAHDFGYDIARALQEYLLVC